MWSRCNLSTLTSTPLKSAVESIRETLRSKFMGRGLISTYTHILYTYNVNLQQNPFCVESLVTKALTTSPSPRQYILCRDANSVHLRARTSLCGSRLCAKQCVRNLFHLDSVKVCRTKMMRRTRYAQNPVWRILTSLPWFSLTLFYL